MLHQVKGNLKKKTICGKVLNRTNFLVVSNAQLQNDDVFKKIFFFVRNLHLKRETLFFCKCFACVIKKITHQRQKKIPLKSRPFKSIQLKLLQSGRLEYSETPITYCM
jgi:hypothetical protein